MKQSTDITLQYYNKQASKFVVDTVNVEFSNFQNAFSEYLPNGAQILDFGCGSGRDSKAFIEKGYLVTSVDGSQELCKLAEEYIGQPVICSTFQMFETTECYDGIWACASLLHLEREDIVAVMKKLARNLKATGCLYVSFKYGTFSGQRNGRYFTDMDEESFGKMLKEMPEYRLDRQYISSDARPGREDEKWLNAFLLKNSQE